MLLTAPGRSTLLFPGKTSHRTAQLLHKQIELMGRMDHSHLGLGCVILLSLSIFCDGLQFINSSIRRGTREGGREGHTCVYIHVPISVMWAGSETSKNLPVLTSYHTEGTLGLGLWIQAAASGFTWALRIPNQGFHDCMAGTLTLWAFSPSSTCPNFFFLENQLPNLTKFLHQEECSHLWKHLGRRDI